MKNTFLLVFLILLSVIAFYFLGKKNGSNNTKIDVVQNVALIKEIAELGALSVSGSTKIKSTNREEASGVMSRLRNYFGENTLNISIPFDAKYGVDMSNQKLVINTKDSTVIIYLPDCKLLSLQLRLDKAEAVSKTGVFRNATIEDFLAAQKHLYENVSSTLQDSEAYKKLAREHISFILQKYYEPLGYTVDCRFGDIKSEPTKP